jgi:hypothetical protein
MCHYFLHDKQHQLIDLHFLQHPRIVNFLPLPSKGKEAKDGWLVSFFKLLHSRNILPATISNETSPCFMDSLC